MFLLNNNLKYKIQNYFPPLYSLVGHIYTLIIYRITKDMS